MLAFSMICCALVNFCYTLYLKWVMSTPRDDRYEPNNILLFIHNEFDSNSSLKFNDKSMTYSILHAYYNLRGLKKHSTWIGVGFLLYVTSQY